MKNISWGMLESPSWTHVRFNKARISPFRLYKSLQLSVIPEPLKTRGNMLDPVLLNEPRDRGVPLLPISHGHGGVFYGPARGDPRGCLI